MKTPQIDDVPVFVFTVHPVLDQVRKRDYRTWQRKVKDEEKWGRTPHLVFDTDKAAWESIIVRAATAVCVKQLELNEADNRYDKCVRRLAAIPGETV